MCYGSMKKLLIIALLTISFFCKGRKPIGVPDARVMVDSTFNWGRFDSIVSDSTKTAFLTNLYNIEEYFGRNGSMEITEENFISWYWNHVHLVDLDQDEDLDLIFDGFIYPGHESGQVLIYSNENGELTKEFGEYGTVIFLDPAKEKMVTHKYPCCSSQMNYLRHYDLKPLADTLFKLVKIDLFVGRNLNAEENLQILPKLLLPKQKTFILTADTTKLRFTPSLEARDICIHGDANIISRYPKHTTGVVLAKSIDGKWLFVQMKYETKGTNRCFTEQVQKDIEGVPHHLYGWINTRKIRYVKRR